MLSRVADAIYWMARDLERAENIARFLDVNWNLALDLPNSRQDPWGALVAVTGDQEFFDQNYKQESKEDIVHFLWFDKNYPNSIISCLSRARENARTIREIMPVEMWEKMNTLYHYVADQSRDGLKNGDSLNQFCDAVKYGTVTIGGLADATMDHDETGMFFHMGRLIERADKTSRVLDVKYFILLPDYEKVGSNVDYVQWTALLKATSSLQAYRHRHGRIFPYLVAEFLLLDRYFPRSVFYCLRGVQKCLHSITGTRKGSFSNDAEKQLGRLCSELTYVNIDDVFEQGLHEFTDQLQSKMNTVDKMIYTTFFSRVPTVENTENPQ